MGHSAKGLKKDKINVFYCYTQQCHLAATAALEFASRGFSVMEMEGGFEAWRDNELEVEKRKPTDQRNISSSVSAFRGAAPSASLSK